jgi:hypothetical protein
MDVMLDMETLATSPDSVVLTFGAVKFDPFTDNIDKGMYIRLDVDEQIALGRKVDEGTLEWWGRQNEQVREEALGEGNRITVDDFTRQLNQFLVGANRIWAQGPVFDIVILENLYRQVGKPAPWPYYTIRDSRTLLKALGDDRKAGADLHNALADCVSQAEAVQSAVKRYKLTEL